MRKILMFITFALLFLPAVSAVDSDLGTIKQYDCISLYQYCPSCTAVNYTAIKYPNGTIDGSFNIAMTKTNTNYNYTFCSTATLGDYFYTVCGDKAGTATCEEISFEVTPEGVTPTTSKLLLFLVLLLLSWGAIFMGINMSDAPITLFGAMGSTLIALYSLFYGIGGIKDTVYTQGFAILLLGASFYVLAKSSWELINS